VKTFPETKNRTALFKTHHASGMIIPVSKGSITPEKEAVAEILPLPMLISVLR
jgi:hypothetical protein